jgi:hypothetical protein
MFEALGQRLSADTGYQILELSAANVSNISLMELADPVIAP